MIHYSELNLITKEDINNIEKTSINLIKFNKKNDRSYDYLVLNTSQKQIFLKKILNWFEITFNLKLNTYSENLYDVYLMNYKLNDFFTKHKDNQYILNHEKRRKYVIGFHLNNDYFGGEYVLYYDNILKVINNEPGLVHCFNADIEHEIKPIISGERKSIALFIENEKIKIKRKRII
jgi:predicted 2-oxoglutarate/Fe(II)-dependent dioxygenase YbiX